jgi:hypothetical protein
VRNFFPYAYLFTYRLLRETLNSQFSCILLIGTAVAFFSGRLAKWTELIEKGNDQKLMNKALKIVPFSFSDAKSDRPALQGRIVHGYDNDELFREDLWLRRIDQSRKQLVAPEASMRLMTRSVGVGEEDVTRICALLASVRWHQIR